MRTILFAIVASVPLMGCTGQGPGTDTSDCVENASGRGCGNTDTDTDLPTDEMGTLRITLPAGFEDAVVMIGETELDPGTRSGAVYEVQHPVGECEVHLTGGLIAPVQFPEVFLDEVTEVDWTAEGSFGVAFDKNCIERSDGDAAHLYTEIRDDNLVHFNGTPGADDVILTGTTFSGERAGDTFEGGIQSDTYVLFQQFDPEGALWKEIEYDCE